MIIYWENMPGVFTVTPSRFRDDRGYFSVPFEKKFFEIHGMPHNFVQDNESYSKRGTLRGLHFQKPPYMQGKLVRVLQGSVQDIIVDLRIGSPTYKQWKSFYISADLGNIVYVPGGFAHGFLALDDTLFSYKCTQFYNKEAEGGIHWQDPTLALPWDITTEDPYISEKDKLLPSLEEALKDFVTYFS